MDGVKVLGLCLLCLAVAVQSSVGMEVDMEPCNCEVNMTDFMNLNESISGDLYLPDDIAYIIGTFMLNRRYNSKFAAVVYVKSAEDVQQVIWFCKKFDLPLTIKSSGHDYIGRSAGPGSVNINMALMKETNIRDDPNVYSGKVIDAQSGANMVQIYKEVDEAGYVFVGGSAHTVAAGGWTAGGGHSPMSRKYGLGVDNCIGFTIVTLDGSIIKLNKTGGTIKRPGSSVEEAYNDPNLFWAVRGGGGGTFGIITSYTYILHPAPEDGFVRIILIYPIKSPYYGKVGEMVLEKFRHYLLYNLTDNWGGYILCSAYKGPLEGGVYTNGLLTFTLLHVGGYRSGAQKAVDDIWKWPTKYQFYRHHEAYKTFWDYEKTIHDPTGFRVRIVNRFLQEKDMMPPSPLPQVMSNDFMDVNDPRLGCTWTLLGGKMRDFPLGSSSVSMNFRNALGSLSCGLGYESALEDKKVDNSMRRYGKKMYSLGAGVYLNEPDYELENWKVEYWGSMDNYDTLVYVKRKYDPDRMLWCHHCPDSDTMPSPYSNATWEYLDFILASKQTVIQPTSLSILTFVIMVVFALTAM